MALLITLWLGVGCAAPSQRGVTGEAVGTVGQTRAVEGRVTAVNEEHGFVVLEFPPGGLPNPGAVLQIYRGDHLVGRVQISEPMRGVFATGNVLIGVPQLGDRARPGGL